VPAVEEQVEAVPAVEKVVSGAAEEDIVAVVAD